MTSPRMSPAFGGFMRATSLCVGAIPFVMAIGSTQSLRKSKIADEVVE
jgi:hypothetical protein